MQALKLNTTSQHPFTPLEQTVSPLFLIQPTQPVLSGDLLPINFQKADPTSHITPFETKPTASWGERAFLRSALHMLTKHQNRCSKKLTS